jgi:asparagine synthetase B (glutamine-hydrolysing)
VRWQGTGERGLAWSEHRGVTRVPTTWREASVELGGCGIVMSGRRRFVHASVSGLTPVYWTDDSDATYFCSRLDPLVASFPGKLSPDWDAWAAIVRLGYAIGSRTPFAEIRRLEHCGRLERGAAGGAATVEPWPWAEVALTSPEEAADALARALRKHAERLDGEEVRIALSGGADSRLLLAAISASGQRPRAWTLRGAWGRSDEEDLAVPAAAAVGAEHTLLDPDTTGFAEDCAAIAAGSEYQQAMEWSWFPPLARGIAGSGVVLDGLAADIFVTGKYAHSKTLTLDERARAAKLWRRLARGRRPRGMLKPRMADAINARARTQWDEIMLRAIGRPGGVSPSIYRHRTTRGMSAGVLGILAPRMPVLAPFTDDTVARAALACPPEAKEGGGFHGLVIERLAPALAGLPVTTFGFETSPRSAPILRESEEALRVLLDLVSRSPLRDWYRGPLLQAVDAQDPLAMHDRAPESRLFNGLATMTLWFERYGDRLGRANPRNLLG